jgi:putative addiction module killer protein
MMPKRRRESQHGWNGWSPAISGTVGNGVSEIRIDFGPGYRVYCAMIGRERVLLLSGGTKRRQAADIAKAVEYLKDFKQRSLKP